MPTTSPQIDNVAPLPGRGAMSSPTVPRALSVAEMQAALEAARRGEFATIHARNRATALAGTPAIEIAYTPTDATGEAWTALDTLLDEPEPEHHGRDRTVLVLGAHAGAGASTVALLLAEAAADSGTRTCLLDCADPASSGLIAISQTELAVDEHGWRHARREAIDLLRPSGQLASPAQLPAADPWPRDNPDTASAGLVVVDTGWPWRALATATAWLSTALTGGQLIVAAHASVPGLRQAEQLLATLRPTDPLLAVLGPRRWPGPVRASGGPLIQAAHEQNRIIAIPLERSVQTTGLGPGELPKSLRAAGRRLLTQLARDTDPTGARPSPPPTEPLTAPIERTTP